MEQQLKDHITFMKNTGVEDFDIAIWVKGYNKAKETLFTEEQVKQAINRAVMLTLSDKSCYSDEIIKSLKQEGNK
jgi:hypothetical protein